MLPGSRLERFIWDKRTYEVEIKKGQKFLLLPFPELRVFTIAISFDNVVLIPFCKTSDSVESASVKLKATVAKRVNFLFPGDEVTIEEINRLESMERERKKDEVLRLTHYAAILDQKASQKRLKKFQKLLRAYVADPKKYRLRSVPELVDIDVKPKQNRP